ncbi:MAG TPA: FkbM family methyltransferase [Mucilaginibacter sp.]|nr:FkbM family methyltransferase [Mucilaginibacter sp.]
MQNLINKIIRIALPEKKVWEVKNRHNIPSMEWSLQNIHRLGFDAGFAIDAGAYDGEWTTMFKKIFPASKVLMLEAQVEKEQVLSRVIQKLPGTYFHIGLLGAEAGKDVVFNVNSTVSSVLEEYKSNDFQKQNRKTETLDDIVLAQRDKLGSPDFIKLDVQGYELEVLKGASNLLGNVQFILCEVSLLEINKGCPLIAEVIRFMDDRSFIPYDICSFIRRPLDKALWQTDVLFIRKNHPLIQNKHWN